MMEKVLLFSHTMAVAITDINISGTEEEHSPSSPLSIFSNEMKSNPHERGRSHNTRTTLNLM